MKRFTPSLLATLLLIGLSGCAAFSGPPVKLYVLGDAAAPVVGNISESGRPVLVLKTVQLPDYLDNQDILTRNAGNEVVASSAGRWAERLSIGMTRAVAAALSANAAGYVILASAPAFGSAPGQIFIDVDSFDARSDGRVYLSARWTVTKPSGDVTVSSRIGLVEPTTPGDAGLAAAMTAILKRLASAIAVSLPPA